MQRGYIVEMGPARPILDAPRHPYSRLLKSAVLSIDDPGAGTLTPADRSEAIAAREQAGDLVEHSDGRLVRQWRTADADTAATTATSRDTHEYI
jgi:peptide/nickel transport system ATP-binding protein